jgi:uncharacterized membrane protein YczE
MSKLKLSDVVWAAWLLLFLALEIPAALGVAPWDTLSRTSWIDERLYPILQTILFGFLIGLAVHIRFSTGLLRTTIGGIVIALILNYLWR